MGVWAPGPDAHWRRLVTVPQRLEVLEEQLRQEPKERMVVLGPEGSVLLDMGENYRSPSGRVVGVHPDKKILENLARVSPGCVIVHNHPNNIAGFSKGDLRTACYLQASEIRTVTLEATYILRPGTRGMATAGFPNAPRVASAFFDPRDIDPFQGAMGGLIDAEIDFESEAKARAGSEADKGSWWQSQVWAKVATRYGFEYAVIPRQGSSQINAAIRSAAGR